MLFVVGGNGGNAGAAAIQKELQEQGVCCSVVGVPKSIDNDILLIDKCFGFDTAVEEAQRALLAAKIEASSARRGIGIVKLMGRQSGFIAMQASLASGVVDACLIPEVPFRLEGPTGLFAYLERVIEAKGHCVICVAEGAGQDILHDGSEGKDASGNPILKDVGIWLKKEIKAHFGDADLKYIDPTYMIRAIPTTSTDRIYCKVLAHQAVHAAFAGYTSACVGLVNTHYAILPISVIVQAPRRGEWHPFLFPCGPCSRGKEEEGGLPTPASTGRAHDTYTHRQCPTPPPPPPSPGRPQWTPWAAPTAGSAPRCSSRTALGACSGGRLPCHGQRSPTLHDSPAPPPPSPPNATSVDPTAGAWNRLMHSIGQPKLY